MAAFQMLEGTRALVAGATQGAGAATPWRRSAISAHRS